MTWVKNNSIIGNEICTQFQNIDNNQLNPQNAYQISPFITNNLTTSQYITFLNFDTCIKTSSNNTKILSASSTSGLSVEYISLNTNIAIISDNILNILSSGIVYIQAIQNGNEFYDPATSVICIFTITIQKIQIGSTSKLEYPISINATTQKNYIKEINITINDIYYTNYSGISYGYMTGFYGSALLGSITCVDIYDSIITDFMDNNLYITITMANADNTHIYKIYKRNNTELINPQPIGYPIILTNISNNDWNGIMTNLSDIVILDETPPIGSAGGDPHVTSLYGIKTLIPNDWKKVKLLETNNTIIFINCDYLTDYTISYLHFINKLENKTSLIDPKKHTWVKDITYIIFLEIMDKISKNSIIFNTISGTILKDNSNFLYEKINIKNNPLGLYSITHEEYYPPVLFKKYVIFFKEGYITLSVDNYWDDINNISVSLYNHINKNYTGEFIKHDINNLLTKKYS